jgi:restriction endonuclease S subunit
MNKVKLGTVLKEEKAKIGKPDGAGLDLIGVSNEVGLQVSRAQRIADLSRYKIIRTGWFAYNPMRVNVGSIGIAQGPHHEGIVSPDYVVFSCSEKILPDYLLFFLKSDIGLEAINKNASGAVRKRLYYSDLARIELNVPSIEKQIEILGSVKKIESMVTKLKDPERLGKVSKLKQSILQEAIQGKLTTEWRAQRKAEGIETEPASELLKRIQAEKSQLLKKKIIKKEKPFPPITEEEKPFELPEGWEWCRLGEFADVQRGIGPRYSENGVLKMINQKCVRWFDIEVIHSKSIDKEWFESLDENRKTKQLDLLVNSTGDGTIGRSAIVDQFAVGFAFDSHVLRVRPYLDFISFYLAMSINSSYGQGLIEDLKGAKSTKQTELGSSNLSSFSISVPPFEEQKAIVEKVESLMEKCRSLDEEISQSEQHAQMLMQTVLKEAFEG